MTFPRSQLTLRVAGGGNFQDLYYAEIHPLLGPEVIGATGDNSYEALYGRPYVLLYTRERQLQLYRGTLGIGGYEYTQITSGLPAFLFGPTLPEGVKHVTAAFDQSARIITAYEEDELVKVTRWTGAEYTQNVTFAGVDPCLLMDATLADPRGYPNLADDGWSVYEAYQSGILVLFEWLAGDPVVWLESAVPDSDVLLFYLTPDRLGVRCRVQRQLYATVNVIHDFAEPIILDRAIALAGRYQLLVSDALGDPLPEMLISDPYLGDFLIAPAMTEALPVNASPEDVVAETMIYATELEDKLASDAAPEALQAVGDLALIDLVSDLPSDAPPEAIEVVSAFYPLAKLDDLPSDAPPETLLSITMIEPTTEEDPLDANAAPETIRVQTV